MTVTSGAVATTKFIISMCDCTFDSDVGTANFCARVGGCARLWTRACVIALVSGHGLICYLASFSFSA